MHKTAVIALAALLTLALSSAPAAAATYKTTPDSTITQISIISKSSKRYRNFHGVLWLQFDSATHNYRWGGAYCGGGSLSELKVSMLFAAFRAKYNVNIEYRENLFKGKRYRCIKGFTVRRS